MSSPESQHQSPNAAPTVPLHAVPNYPPHEWLSQAPGQEPVPAPEQPVEQVDAYAEESQIARQGKLQAIGSKIVGLTQKVNDYKFDASAHPHLIESVEGNDLPSTKQTANSLKQGGAKIASYLGGWAGVSMSEATPVKESYPPNSPNNRERTTLLSPDTTVNRMEHEHYVKVAPRFENLLQDTTRTNTFKYVASKYELLNNDPGRRANIVKMTEYEGLNKLHDFLSDYLKFKIKKGEGDYNSARIAKGMMENLTFIGEKEYKEGAEGIGNLWKAYLDADPQNQLCIPNKISKIGGKRKSDVFLFENILSSFSDEELEQYGGRIVTDLNQITKEPDNVRIVLLDDWTISGSQMQQAYGSIKNDYTFAKYADCVEVNLIVGSKDRLKHGLRVSSDWNGTNEKRIPVKAYFKAHDAEKTSSYGHKAHVTGTHSSVDYDFEHEINTMVDDLNYNNDSKLKNFKGYRMPPLSNIVRPYRYAKPKIRVLSGGRIIRNKV